jgi:hypothetical protein
MICICTPRESLEREGVGCIGAAIQEMHASMVNARVVGQVATAADAQLGFKHLKHDRIMLGFLT